MKFRNFFLTVLAVACVLNVIWGCRTFTRETVVSGNSELVDNLDNILNVYRLIRNNYVDGEKISSSELIQRAIQGMTSGLDPFSVYMPPREAEQFKQESSGEFGGIGAVLSEGASGYPQIDSVLDGTPAYEAGLVAGDEIIAIEGNDMGGKGNAAAVGLLRGEPGTMVCVTVRHAGTDETSEKTLVRAVIPMLSVVNVCVIPDTTIGHLRITQFTMHTAEEYEKALRSLEAQKITGLVIDLRGNPGGLLEIVARMCGFMLPVGAPIVTVEGRDAKSNYGFNAQNEYKFAAIPVVILIDRGSASAAEIMSGCLKDHHRAVLVGEKSYGKGSVQTVFGFDNGASLKLTVAKYYTPSHKPIHGIGIFPDVIAPMSADDYRHLNSIKDDAARLAEDPNIQIALKIFSGEITVSREEANEEAAEEAQPADENETNGEESND